VYRLEELKEDLMSLKTLDVGCSGLTDNWLLQDCATVLERLEEPTRIAHWLAVKNGALNWYETSVGAIQIESLCALIEQIVFCDKLLVMAKWTEAWSGKSPQLQTLFGCELVDEFDESEECIADLKQGYVEQLCRNPAVREEHYLAAEGWERGEPRYSGQLIAGSTGYLAQATIQNLAYTPHPVRARFLKTAMYDIEPAANPRRVLNELVNTQRTRLTKRIGWNCSVTTLSCVLPSIALLCLRESSPQSLPIMTALQMRDSNEFRRLRQTLHEIQLAISRDDTSTVTVLSKMTNMLERAISEIQRVLGTRPLGERDGFAEVPVFQGLSIKVPDELRGPLVAPRHTAAMFRLIATAVTDLRGVLRKSLGIDDPRVIHDLIDFSRDHGRQVKGP
jgi:hypothetical protein